jgi:hypothetical protein
MRSRFAILLCAAPQVMIAAQPRPETLSALEFYLDSTESQLRSEASGDLLWIDKAPCRRDQVRGGEIVAGSTSDKPFHSVRRTRGAVRRSLAPND